KQMAWKTDKAHKKFAESEIGAIRKDWAGHIKIALVYPNRYHVGMSNLGFQTVYHLLNDINHVLCERSFLPEKNRRASANITTIESGRPISDFDIIAFSISFENDYLNLLTILSKAGLPPHSGDRQDHHPFVIAGGVACFLNPEPIAPFIDCFLIGEAEGIFPRFFSTLLPELLNTDKESLLKILARKIPGVYVPSFYRATYNPDGTICSFKPVCDVPDKIKRIYLKDISHVPTCSSILTPHTTFKQTFLIEVGRGCPHGCRFCTAGYIYRPPRFRSLSLLKKCIEQGALLTDRIGLVGAAVSDFPDIAELCSQVHNMNIRISFSSFRADALTPELISVLRQSRVKTATIAPDAGSERMRKVINKGITEEDILNAAEILVLNGIPNLKLYFMIGLPTETMDDVEAVVKLCKQIKNNFLKSSRIKKHIGEITVSLNSFVPKPFTPFQWAAMEDVPTLKKKILLIRKGLKNVPNVRVKADVPRQAYIQDLLSRGDRRVARILSSSHLNNGNWAKTLKETDLNHNSYVLRERSFDELLPWDFIDHGIKKTFLVREYKRAMQARISSPCPMESCDICGVCKKG
ncbi:MAG: TIGR03960 family B12-binding radical SAM protein, partial [Thermodesulfobacteriota bacterium]|nr:TIGR03960 family B12-binding radical SAM protein [Thermodesulfobacteriota bacterium]